MSETEAQRLAAVTALAHRVFEEPSLADEFLGSPQPQLGGERPLDLARTAEGAERVTRLLYALEYSLPD